jgi:cytochrome c-type biogenesis protein CcmH/NrfF
VSEGDKEYTMYPAKWFFRKHEEEPTTEVAIRRGASEDLYIVMPAFDLQDQSASLHVVVNPLVNWIWVGFAVMALGTGIALMPERAYSFAVAKLPAEAASTTTALLVLILLLPAVARAQHVETGQTVPVIARSALERDLQENMICMCGTCGRQLLSQCQCGYAQNMRKELAGLVAEGRTREQVIDFYIAKYGSQEPLAQPIDKGFNRLAWVVPYVLGATGLLVTGFVAVRWTRRGSTTNAQASAHDQRTPADPALESRLNDELSNLD